MPHYFLRPGYRLGAKSAFFLRRLLTKRVITDWQKFCRHSHQCLAIYDLNIFAFGPATSFFGHMSSRYQFSPQNVLVVNNTMQLSNHITTDAPTPTFTLHDIAITILVSDH